MLTRPLTLTIRRDRWYVDCGRRTREWIHAAEAWCHEGWGSGWGYFHQQRDQVTFVFFQSSQANWFMLKYNS